MGHTNTHSDNSHGIHGWEQTLYASGEVTQYDIVLRAKVS